jgi:DNA-directed RNA polymerase specialized sigma54-like protein
MDLGLEIKQTQNLSPQMMQAMEILQMGSQELLEYLEETLQENPVLERERAGGEGERERGGRPAAAEAGVAGIHDVQTALPSWRTARTATLGALQAERNAGKRPWNTIFSPS